MGGGGMGGLGEFGGVRREYHHWRSNALPPDQVSIPFTEMVSLVIG